MRAHARAVHAPACVRARALTTDGAVERARAWTAALVPAPDKNPERIADATREFAELQNAYSVLSDAHERAWYDGHREQILREGTPRTHRRLRGQRARCAALTADRLSARAPPPTHTHTPRPRERPDDDGEGSEAGSGIDLMPFFSASAFNGYGDDGGGFYAVYRDVFAEIARAEAAAANADDGGDDGDDVGDDDDDVGRNDAGGPALLPPFGASASDENTVRAFYAHWSSFATRQPFAQADKYRLSEAPNRQVRRLMEKENRKLREQLRREFQDTVRVRP